MKNRKIVFYTGAGISKESGMPTFRGEGGLWDTLDVTAVADARNWYSGRRNDRRNTYKKEVAYGQVKQEQQTLHVLRKKRERSSASAAGP